MIKDEIKIFEKPSIEDIKEKLKDRSGFKVRFSLWQKFLLAFVTLIVGAVLLLGSIAIRSEKDVIQKKVIESCFEISDIISHEIGQLIENANKILISTSKVPAVRSFDVGTIKAIFESLLSSFKIFTRIAIIDIEGREVYSTLQDTTPMTSKVLYSLIVKGNYNAYYQSDIYFVDENLPTLTMAILVRDSAFKVSGILIADLDLRMLWPIIDRIQLGKTGVSYIINQQGYAVAHSTDKTLIGKKLSNAAYLLSKIDESKIDNSKDSSVLKATLNASDDNLLLYAASPLNKFKPTQNYSSIFFPPAYVILEQTKKEAFIEAELLQKQVWYFMFVCFIIAVIIALILAVSLTRPIFKLVDDANRIAKGDLATAVAVRANDEVGQLAYNFDLMRQNLAYKVWELETINEVGQKISAVLNLEDLMRLILSKYIETIGADRASIMLYDEETGQLTASIAKVSTSDLESYNVDKHEGLSGHVYQTGKAVLIKDAQNSEMLRKFKKGEIYPGTLISVPLIVKERTIGVVNAAKSIPDYFSDREFSLFNSLSVQGAIAIDNAILYKLAITDGLTKLYLHRYFQHRLSDELSRSERYGYKFSLILTDIDHFKKFNDTYGHQVGDQVLREVARLVQQSVREVDMVARYGGEEFVVICPEKSNEETIVPAERIRKAIESYEFKVDGKLVPITISLGVSEFPSDSKDKKELIECADIALYSSKQNGRNRFTRFCDIPPNMRSIKEMKH